VQEQVVRPSSADVVRPSSGDVVRLGTAYFVSGALNGVKFLLLPVALSAHELDVIAIGVLMAVTFGQIFGEAVANHHVIAPGERGTRARRATELSAAGLFGVAAAFPHTTANVLAGGIDLSGSDEYALRLFALAGLTWVAQWAGAGRRQAAGDLRGLRSVVLAPNIALLVGLVLSGGDLKLLATSMLLISCVLVGRQWRAAANARPVQPTRARPAGAMVGLIFAGLASAANLVVVRAVAADLPAGSLGALYIVIGVSLLPVMATAGALASASFPKWAVRRDTIRLSLVAKASLLAAILGGSLLATVAVALDLGPVKDWIDPSVRTAMREALPWLGAGIPLGAEAWLIRAWLLATGQSWAYVVSAFAGSTFVLIIPGSEPSVATVAAGYSASAIPVLLTGLALRLRRERRRTMPPAEESTEE
jgi:hypothetical protein